MTEVNTKSPYGRHCIYQEKIILTFFSLDGEVRLRRSNKGNSDRVEIQLGGVWGTVALRHWDIRDAHVLCRQLGYHKAVRVTR